MDILIYKNYETNKKIINQSSNIYYKKISQTSIFYNEKLKKIALENNIKFLNPFDLFCEDNKKICYVLTDEGKKIYWDYGHSTIAGLKYISKINEKTDWFNLN